jgi:peptidoglycan/xylan/chitin deacetylase (PgdA/CDA1 family)
VPVSITFDDDLPSHIEYALPALTRYGLPAAFFLNGPSLRERGIYWWDPLQRAVDQRLPELESLLGASSRSETIQALGEQIESLHPAERRRLAASLQKIAGGDPADTDLSEADVTALKDAGFEIGFHTLSHDPLPALDDDALRDALTEGRAELADLVASDLRLLAYPHGQADARVAAAARSAGYKMAFTTEEEPVSGTSHPLLLGRFTPSFVSVEHFASQIAKTLLRGVTPSSLIPRLTRKSRS